MIFINFQAESKIKAKAKGSCGNEGDNDQKGQKPQAGQAQDLQKICFSPCFNEETLWNSRTVSGCGAPYIALTDLGQQYFEREKVDFGGKQAIS